jgi:hypothetical protein
MFRKKQRINDYTHRVLLSLVWRRSLYCDDETDEISSLLCAKSLCESKLCSVLCDGDGLKPSRDVNKAVNHKVSVSRSVVVRKFHPWQINTRHSSAQRRKRQQENGTRTHVLYRAGATPSPAIASCTRTLDTSCSRCAMVTWSLT